MKRCLSFVLCIVLAVTACIYLPSNDEIPTVSAAYAGCGHHNFSCTATDQILICQPLAQNADTLAAVSSGKSSGFEAGPGLTYDGTIHNQTARITVSRGSLSKLVYSSATSDQKALLDAWASNRGAHIEEAYIVSSDRSTQFSGDWGYDIVIEWDTAIDLSVLSHFYMQFWLVNMGGLSTAQSSLTNTPGHFWFNLIGTDSPHSIDGWNFPVYINQLAGDKDGKVNTAHYYTFPISSAHGKYGNLKSVKKMGIRYFADGNGCTAAPTMILGKFMMEVPTDNVQVGMTYKNSSGTNYTTSTAPDPKQTAPYRIVGKDTANSVCGVRFPMFVAGKGTFVVALRWGNYSMDQPFFWAWRYKPNRAQTGTMTVSQNGGAQSCQTLRNNSKYLSSTTYYHITY